VADQDWSVQAERPDEVDAGARVADGHEHVALSLIARCLVYSNRVPAMREALLSKVAAIQQACAARDWSPC
jgi:hypothetical protein